MRSRPSPLLAAASALALCVQSTGAASIPAAMLPSAGAFSPFAARLGAFPARRAATAPAGPSWFDSARVVADYFYSRAREPFDPAPAPAEIPAAEKSAPTAPAAAAAPAPAPAVEAPTDRMLIVMEPGRRVEAVIDNNFQEPPRPSMSLAPFPQRTLPPFREKTIESNGLRATLSYIRAHGTITGRPDGYTLSFPGGTPRLSRSPAVPPAYRRAFPIYFPNEEVEISMTVANVSGHTIADVRLEAVQEIFQPAGTEGARILPPKSVAVADSLAPGQEVVVRWRTRLMGPADKPVNLEQTHVRIAADGRAEALIDAPQAGVVDPPGPGLL